MSTNVKLQSTYSTMRKGRDWLTLQCLSLSMGMLLGFLGNGIYIYGMAMYPRVNLLNLTFSTVSAAFSLICPGKEKPYKLYVENCR